MMVKFKAYLSKEFDTNDDGELQWFLSVQDTWNDSGDVMALDQRAYVEKLIDEWGFEGMKIVKTPMVEGFKIFPSDLPDKIDLELQANYHRLLG